MTHGIQRRGALFVSASVAAAALAGVAVGPRVANAVLSIVRDIGPTGLLLSVLAAIGLFAVCAQIKLLRHIERTGAAAAADAIAFRLIAHRGSLAPQDYAAFTESSDPLLVLTARVAVGHGTRTEALDHIDQETSFWPRVLQLVELAGPPIAIMSSYWKSAAVMSATAMQNVTLLRDAQAAAANRMLLSAVAVGLGTLAACVASWLDARVARQVARLEGLLDAATPGRIGSVGR